jgi:heparosan-N-sulfate-glucuronate 5-epimerase
MQYANNTVETLACALRAMSREVLQFRFHYPLEMDAAAGPRSSLHYYLYSEKLSWSIMSMDATGVPRARIRLAGVVYKPAYIAWWGLIKLGHFLRHHDIASRDAFLKQVDWLESHAVTRPDGAVVWFNDFDSLQGKTLLRAPWISAYDQGLVISALVRGYRLTGRPRLLELLQGASRIFTLGIHEDGVRESVSPGAAVYSELPGQGIPGIQDGFMSSLLGLYDLFVETGDAVARQLFDEGIAGLKALLPVWDYRQRWSWYGSRAYLCPPPYHYLNRLLLEVLGQLTGEALLSEYAQAWKTDRLSVLARAEIFLVFLLTKNACRVRNRTWQFDRAKVRTLALRHAMAGVSTVGRESEDARAICRPFVPGA